jgi:NAD(P)-dependent dehydrogenase (short-subunit alcohol dehydrogenase family)
LENKIAVVTGAGAGIGKASVDLFAKHGAKVVCVDLDLTAAKGVADVIVSRGEAAIALQADVRLWSDAQRIIGASIEAFGRVDILFNNAGTGVRGRLHELEEKDWDLVMETNLKSVYLFSKAVIPHFLERGTGNVINTASTFGLLAAPNYAAYCASKGGVISLTKQMALDYGPGIRVNCICPGATDTPRLRRQIAAKPDPVSYLRSVEGQNIVMQRLAEPSEIASVALFLASDEASFCTGSTFVVDGGQTCDA